MFCKVLLQISVVSTDMFTLTAGKFGVDSIVTMLLPPGGKDSYAVLATIHSDGFFEKY